MKEELKAALAGGIHLANHCEDENFRLLIGRDRKNESDLNIEDATLQGLVNFVQVRATDIKGEDEARRSHFVVDTRRSSIVLVQGEHGGSDNEEGKYLPVKRVTGSSKFTNDRNTVNKLMSSASNAPHDLALQLRELPHLFSSEEDWKKAVGTLRGLKVVVEKTMKDTSNEDTGEREKRLHLVIKEGCPPLEWKWRYAIYEGQPEEEVFCRVLYEVNSTMSGVNIMLTNFERERQERAALKKMMDKTITELKAAVGESLPFVYVN